MIDSWSKTKKISVVVDTPGWFDIYADKLVKQLQKAGHEGYLCRSYDSVTEGDIGFYLSCMKITPPAILSKNRFNYVAHASDLPKGRGFSPIAWQILEGRNQIPVTLIEMAEEVDSGDIIMQKMLDFEGHELNSEIRDCLGQVIVEMCIDIARKDKPPKGHKQVGEPTWYERRRPKDSSLDPNATIANQFDLLRTVDNNSYPAFFEYRGFKYRLTIDKIGPATLDAEDTYDAE